MKTLRTLAPMSMSRRKLRALMCVTALISFAAGSLVNASLVRSNEAIADDGRVFELLVYHAVPGRVPALVSRFGDASKLQARHGLDVVGYWVPDGTDPAWADTFVYVIAHSSREQAKKNWDAFHSDPAFETYVKAEEADPLIQGVDSTYMRPADYSRMK